MKIKLLQLPRYLCDPDTGENINHQFFPPLGIATLTGLLKQHNFSVEQDDLNVKVQYANLSSKSRNKVDLRVFIDEKLVNNFIKYKHSAELEEECEKILRLTNVKGVDITGFSLEPDQNLSTSTIAMAFGKVIKERYGSTIIVGGSIRENVTKALLKSGFVDFGIHRSNVYSISETAFLKFCEGYEKGKTNIPGLMYLDKNKLFCDYDFNKYTPQEKFLFIKPDFDGLPLDLYKCEISGYAERRLIKSKIFFLPYFFVRGCPNKCSFCSYSIEPWAVKDPSAVALDLKKLSKRYNTKFFYFLNPCINPSYKYAERIADELIKEDLNILWTDCVQINNIDQKLINKLKASGGLRFVFGVESGSQRILKYIKKPYSISFAEKVIQKTHKAGVGVQIDVICGFPYETNKDINCTVNFIRRNLKYIDWIDLFKFYVSGDIYERPEKYGIKFRKNNTKLYNNWSTEAFDEINGISWKEKIIQTNYFYEKIMNIIPNQKRPIDPYLLFFHKTHQKVKKAVYSNQQ